MPIDPKPTPPSGPEGFDPGPQLLFAAGLAQAGEMDRAEAAYQDLLTQVPDFHIARFQLGLLQFTSARPAVALRTWAPLDHLADTHPLRLFKQAFAFLAEDRFEATVALLREGMTHNTDNPPLNRDMQMMIDRLKQAGLLCAEPSLGGPETEPIEGAEAPSHFLLSSYRTPPS